METLGLKTPDTARALGLARGPFSVDEHGQLEALATFLRAHDNGSRLELEHYGVDSSLVTVLCHRLGTRLSRMREILGLQHHRGLPLAGGDVRIQGGPAFAVLALVELLGKAMELVENSTAPEAKGFDTAKWLGKWIELRLPAISGVMPSEIIALPTGLPVLLQVIGAMQSGVFL